MARLAGVLHVLDLACSGSSVELLTQPPPITEDAVIRATRLVEYFLHQFDALQAQLGNGFIPRDLARIVQLATEKGGQVTTRDLLLKHWASTKEEAVKLFQQLVNDYGTGSIRAGKRKDQIIFCLEVE